MHRLLVPDLFSPQVTAFFTGKIPGADPDALSRMLHIMRDRIYMPIQKHTDKVAVIDSSLEPVIADAVVTRRTGILIGVQAADCVPILLYDTAKGIMGAVHAGWRGTSGSILVKTVQTMRDRFSCSPEDITVAIGPAIRWCCYHVGYDVLGAVKQATGPGEYTLSKSDAYCLDLPNANRVQSLRIGIPEKNIWLSEDCTFCNPGTYYSYRFARGTTGRQGAFIGRF